MSPTPPTTRSRRPSSPGGCPGSASTTRWPRCRPSPPPDDLALHVKQVPLIDAAATQSCYFLHTLVTQTGSAEWVWEGDPAARLLDELAAAGPAPDDILQTAVTFLSTIRPGTWVALAMNTDPSTSRVYMADEADP